MSDSSSDQQNTFDIEDFPEENRQRIREILRKGKNIAPFYNDQILYNFYKRYYQNEKVYLNELQIVAKNKIQIHEQDNEEQWISVGKTNNNKSRSNNARYNFLEDKKLIWRAQNWGKQETKKTNQQKRYTNGDKVNHKNKSQFEQKSQKRGNKYRQKEDFAENNNEISVNKQFKEKQHKQTKYQQKNEQKKPAQKKEGSKYVEKKGESKYVEKKQEPTYVEKKQQVHVYIQKKQEKKDEPKKVEKKNEVKKVQNKQETKKVQKKQEHKYVEKKQNSNTHKKYVQKVQEVKNTEKPVAKEVKEVKEIKKVQVKDQVQDAMKNFQKSLKQYPKILRFIKPGEKTQIISYVSGPSGARSDVKIRIPLS